MATIANLQHDGAQTNTSGHQASTCCHARAARRLGLNVHRQVLIEAALLRVTLLMCGSSERLRGIREAIEMYLAEQEDFTSWDHEPDSGVVSSKRVKQNLRRASA